MKIDVILSPESSPAEICELGLLAESYGIQSAWSSNYPSSRDPFLTLAPLALQSKTLRVGPLVVTAYEQHPFKTAKALATSNFHFLRSAVFIEGKSTGDRVLIAFERRVARH